MSRRIPNGSLRGGLLQDLHTMKKHLEGAPAAVVAHAPERILPLLDARPHHLSAAMRD